MQKLTEKEIKDLLKDEEKFQKAYSNNPGPFLNVFPELTTDPAGSHTSSAYRYIKGYYILQNSMISKNWIIFSSIIGVIATIISIISLFQK